MADVKPLKQSAGKIKEFASGDTIADSFLTKSYLYADGTRPLTGNWNMGAFSATFTKTDATAATVYDAFIATNTTVASSGNQMYGGFYYSIGNGWKTTATAASQAVGFRWGTIPVQGATNPTGKWTLDNSINGAAYSTLLSVSSTTGILTLVGGGTINNTIGTNAIALNAFGIVMGGNYASFGGNTVGYNNSLVSNTYFGTYNAQATARIQIKGGTATASTAPLKFTAGTNLTTPEAGAMEYDGTNLLFTRSGTTREGVLTQSAVTTETLISDTSVTINIGGTTYKLLAKA